MAKVKDGSFILKPYSDEAAALGRRFRAARERSGLSLYGLAAAIGKSFYIIRRHEAGHTMLRVDDLIASAKAMKVRPRDLLEVD